MRRLAVALLMVAPLAGAPQGCGRSERGGEPAPGEPAPGGDDAASGDWKAAHAAAHPAVPPSALADLPAMSPRWLVRLPDEPGQSLVERVAGPVVEREVAVVASSVIGAVGLDRTSGAVRWQHRPGASWDAVLGGGDGSFWLVGDCPPSGKPDDTDTPAPPGRVLGCLEQLDGATGQRRALTLLVVPDRLGWHNDFAGAPSRALRRDGVLHWARRSAVVSADPDSGLVRDARIVAHSDPLDLPPRRPGAPAASAIAPPSMAPSWQLTRSSDTGEPVEVGDLVAVVRDGSLLLQPAAPAKRRGPGPVTVLAPGSLSSAPGALQRRDDHTLVALQQASGRIGPVVADVVTRSFRPGADAVAAVQALVATGTPDGGLAVVLRLDTSLMHDAVVLFDAAGGVTGAWPIPVTAPRPDPIGLAAAGELLVVFWDGRFAAGLALPKPRPAPPATPSAVPARAPTAPP